jgi:EAL domain-containing protein (putative c-di-GMP-specific phosphodiesterase class I)
VEDAATAAELISLGADVMQGYHLSRPLPPEHVVTFIRPYFELAQPGAALERP